MMIASMKIALPQDRTPNLAGKFAKKSMVSGYNNA
jgi:hypothetical protein